METKELEQKESIKLTKSARGVYHWEIKLLSLDINLLETLDKKMREKFNTGVVDNGAD